MKQIFATVVFVMALVLHPLIASAAQTDALKASAQQALQQLYDSNADAAQTGKDAKAVLVFPEVVKVGFVLGGSHGEGVLFKIAEVVNYYTTTGGSWGLQAGMQSYGYAVFLMSDDAVDYLDRSNGWEIGAGPSIVVLNHGHAKRISSTTVKSDAYAVIFGQRGLMAGLGIEGSKISPMSR